MALPVNGSTHLIPALLLIYRPRKDERLSWPSWLTCSGWLTHNSGHPSAAGRAQDRESSPARDRRSTTVLRHQPCVQVERSKVDGADTEKAPRGNVASNTRWSGKEIWIGLRNILYTRLSIVVKLAESSDGVHTIRADVRIRVQNVSQIVCHCFSRATCVFAQTHAYTLYT